MPNKKYEYVNFSPEDGKKVTEELTELLKKYDAEFVVTPLITEKGTIGSRLEIFKKVELLPKDGVQSPYADGETGTKETA